MSWLEILWTTGSVLSIFLAINTVLTQLDRWDDEWSRSRDDA